ncbi:MAG: hypothetical protein IJY46_07425 [Lentisphaeria bacterium]|nr:hypothetical protein [Lentisphaeria bacterium]
MSFVEIPSKIRNTMPIIRAAILERYAAFGSNSMDIFVYKFNPPFGFHNAGFKNVFEDFRRHIKTLYARAFPPENVGKWSALRPNLFDIDKGWDQNPLLDAEIARKLQEANIDPSGFFWEVPHRFCDGNFVRACRYLLNKSIYFLPESIGRECKTTETIYSNYDKGKFVKVEHDDSAGALLVSVASGYLKENMIVHHSPRFVNVDEKYYPILGDWRLRYRAQLSSYLDSPVNKDDEGEYFFNRYVGDGEVACHGGKSEIFELMPESLENKSYYQRWGDLRYNYVSRTETQIVTQVKVTKENFPPLNYKYLD